MIFDNKGTSALEFAFIAPIAIMLFAVVVEVTNYLTVVRRAEMSNNSMAQVLSVVDASHEVVDAVRGIPAIINPNQVLSDKEKIGARWSELPFSFSQIVFESDPDGVTASRDFIYAMPYSTSIKRACDVELIDVGQAATNNLQLSEKYVQIGNPVLSIGHTAHYVPTFVQYFNQYVGTLGSGGTIPIVNVSYVHRYDNALWRAAVSGSSSIHRLCNGP